GVGRDATVRPEPGPAPVDDRARLEYLRRTSAKESPVVVVGHEADLLASVPQQLPNRFVGSAVSCQGQTRMVMPTTSAPCSTSKAAATDESTPPLIPTTMRSVMA